MGALLFFCCFLFGAYLLGGVWAALGIVVLFTAVLCYEVKKAGKEQENTQQHFDEAISKLYSEDSVILDTETTGFSQSSEIIEICITDTVGNVLLSTLVKPKRKMRADNKAVAVHGITNEMLADAPKWPEIHEQVAGLLAGKNVIIYNAEFDSRLLAQTAAKYGLQLPEFKTECAMVLYGFWAGEKNQYGNGFKRHKLSSAAERLGVEINGHSHRAETDCLTVAMILKKMKELPVLPRR